MKYLRLTKFVLEINYRFSNEVLSYFYV